MVSPALPQDPAPEVPRSLPAAVLGGGVIGTLGGLTGLGGAKFRLPLLIGLFRFPALEAVILNNAASLIVVATALPFRASAVPLNEVVAPWPVLINLLARSLLGARHNRQNHFPQPSRGLLLRIPQLARGAPLHHDATATSDTQHQPGRHATATWFGYTSAFARSGQSPFLGTFQ